MTKLDERSKDLRKNVFTIDFKSLYTNIPVEDAI
jgi:DNA polymerase elongation subunit (family B)